MIACNKCGETKTLEYFAVNKRRPSGRNTICRECVAARMRSWSVSESGKKYLEQRKRDPEIITRRRQNRRAEEYRRKQKEYRDRPEVKRALKAYQQSDEHRKKRRDIYRKTQSAQARLFESVCRSHGIDTETWARMYNAQNRACAACSSTLKFDRSTAIDHCHVTNRVRGLLCMGCNVALGHTRDDPARLRRLAEYIERQL